MNDPLPLTVADKVLEIVIRGGLVEKSQRLGEYLPQKLQQLRKFPVVLDIRGKGLMIRIELSTEALGRRVVQRLIEFRLWLAIIISGMHLVL